jgi:hypothetical protein
LATVAFQIRTVLCLYTCPFSSLIPT